MFVLSLLTVVLIVFILNRKRQHSYVTGLVEPPGNFILGHITKAPSNLAGILTLLDDYFGKFGNCMVVRLGPSFYRIREVILCSDYKLIEFVLTSTKILKKSENYYFLHNWLKNGLVTSDGIYWRRHRKILTPAFHFDILKDFVQVFEKVGDVFLEKLTAEASNNKHVDVDKLVTLCTIDIVCETAMGTKINALNSENQTYVQGVKDICQLSMGRALSVLKLFDFTYWLTKDYYFEKKVLKIVHGFTLGLIKAKKQTRDQLNNNKTKRIAFMDLLIKFSQSENLLTDEEIQEEVDTIMFAGHDTTSSAICFVLYTLCEHPSVQEKVYQEQKALFGPEKNPNVSHTDLQNMSYLEKVIKETLRLYPPVPFVGRLTKTDVEFDGCKIPKHTNIFMSVFHLHRNAEFFPEPEKFLPERFDNLNGLPPYAYIPFSAGLRNCIGQKFAMLVLKSILSKVVRNFEIKPTEPRHRIKLTFEAVLKPENGVRVVLKKRV